MKGIHFIFVGKMKGILLILFLYVVCPLVSFGGHNPAVKKGPGTEATTVNPIDTPSTSNGVLEEEEFYKTSSEEKKSYTSVKSQHDTKTILKNAISVSLNEIFEESQDRSYLFKIGVLRL